MSVEEKPGLQGERTELAWERSALALLSSAALLLLRHVGPDIGRVLLVAAQLSVALLTVWYARRRGRKIRALDTDGDLSVPDAHRELLGITVAVMAISLGTALTIWLGI
jgi:uncharacterized membrane protein YidH (DUF202 family)